MSADVCKPKEGAMEKQKVGVMYDRDSVEAKGPISLVVSRTEEFVKPKLSLLSTPSSPNSPLKGRFGA